MSNNKWSSNDYDKEGWQNMAHSDNRPIPTYLANFDINDNSLSDNELNTILYLSLKTKQLFKTKSLVNAYQKTE